jgi:hypothetical protein
LAALDNEFWKTRLVIDSENDECNSEDEETFMHETIRVEYPSNPETEKNKMRGRERTAGKPWR